MTEDRTPTEGRPDRTPRDVLIDALTRGNLAQDRTKTMTWAEAEHAALLLVDRALAAIAAEPVPLTLDALTEAVQLWVDFWVGLEGTALDARTSVGIETMVRQFRAILAALASPDKGEPR